MSRGIVFCLISIHFIQSVMIDLYYEQLLGRQYLMYIYTEINWWKEMSNLFYKLNMQLKAYFNVLY